MAEVEGRGQEAGGDQAERQRQADETEPAVGRHESGRAGQAEQEQQAVTGPGGGGEEDDGRRWMHGLGLEA